MDQVPMLFDVYLCMTFTSEDDGHINVKDNIVEGLN